MQPVIRQWNSLPQDVIKAKNLARLKEGLDIYMVAIISRVLIVNTN